MAQTRFTDDEDHERGLDLQLLKRVLGYASAYRWLTVALVGIMLFFALLDSLPPLLTRYAIDHFIVPRTTVGLVSFGVVVAIIAFARGVAVWFMIRIGGKLSTHISYDIRRNGFNHLQALSFSYFDKRPVGWLLARLTSDAENLGRALSWGIVDIVWGVGMILIMTVIMLALNVKLALIVLAVVPLLAFMTIRLQRSTLMSFRNVRRINSEITGAFNEGITGARTSKTLVREETNLSEFQAHTGRLQAAAVGAARRAGVYLPLVLGLGAVGSAAALWAGGKGVLAGSVSYGTLVAFVSYAVRFFHPLQDIANRFPVLQNAQAAAERIFSMIATVPEITDSAEVCRRYASTVWCGGGAAADGDVAAAAEQAAAAADLPVFTGHIEFDHVSFAYDPDEPVLDDFCLEIRPGETVALVGSTGTGKSTVVNLVCRFYEPLSGSILIEGIDCRELPLAWLQSQLGIVQQTPHLFSGTIADNIRYGRLDATDAEVRQAAELVHAHEFIEAGADGYVARVGEEGTKLSTGQKQLISLARAMLADPKLLILDEATSSVDAHTEKLIQSGIGQVLHGRTSFIIAHRLSTVRAADRIIVIEGGRIVEQGSHHALIREGGQYCRLYRAQFISEKETEILK